MAASANAAGRIAALRGPVLDVCFEGGRLPPIEEAQQIPGGGIAEVQAHIDATTVRAASLQPTSGLPLGAGCGW